MPDEKIPCRECNDPVAEIRGGKLVIIARHHGGKHKNIISIPWLVRKLEESKQNRDNISTK
jgi:hypothetical protein